MGRLSVRKPKVIICDLEGTTTSVRFWSEILTPFVKENIEPCLREWWTRPETRDTIEVFRRKVREDILNGDIECPPIAEDGVAPREIAESVTKAVSYFLDLKRHFEELKAMLLLVWLYGSTKSLIQSHVYRDVPEAFRAWNEQGIKIITFSTAIVPAQKLALTCSLYGNLTGLVDEFFDSDAIGKKSDPESYKKIIKLVKVQPSEVLYLTDTISELNAAKAAGIVPILVIRTHNVNLTYADHNFKCIVRLDELEFA